MDETTDTGLGDAWLSARLGNAIDAGVDRVLNRPQFAGDPAQAYGVDQNGNLYTLGKTNSQIAAQVTTQTAAGGGFTISPLLVLVVLAVLAIEAKK